MTVSDSFSRPAVTGEIQQTCPTASGDSKIAHDALTFSSVLVRLVARISRPVVVQIGAYDGITGDPIHEFLQERSVRAILVEPQPIPFAALTDRYAANAQIETVNAAIAAEDGDQPLYILKDSRADDPWWAGQIASFQRNHLLRHAEGIPDLASRVESITVKAMTPQRLMSQYQLKNIHLLVVDAEGADWRLVKLFLDLRVAPNILYFEWKHLPQTEILEMRRVLTELEYRVEFFEADVLAYRDLD